MNINATLLAQALSFAILIGFTVKFVWPLITSAMDERAKRIADGLAAAERGKHDLEVAGKRSAEELDKAKKQAAEIVAMSERRASAIVEEAKTQAKVEGDRIVAGAKAELDQELQRAKAALRNQVAALAVVGAEKILKREVDQKAHADILGELSAKF